VANSNAAQAGHAQAEADIAAGLLRYIHCHPDAHGQPAAWVREYHRLLREELGVEGLVSFECPYSGTRSRKDFAAEYNRRMKTEIERRFGPDTEAKLAQRAWGHE